MFDKKTKENRFHPFKDVSFRAMISGDVEDSKAELYSFNMIVFLASVIGALALLESIAIHTPVVHLVVLIISELVAVVGFFLANTLGRLRLAIRILLFFVVLVLFPILFFTCGGYHGGMVFWFTIGIIFTFLVMQGQECLFFVILEILMDISCLLLSYTRPALVTPFRNERDALIDITISMVLTAICMGFLVKNQFLRYKMQVGKQEEQNDKLESLREEAVKASSAKSEFLANMSHEIRTPMNAIIGMSRVALRENMNDEVRSSLNDILNAGESLLTIINDILDFSKIESGEMMIVPQNYQFSSMIHDTITVINYRLLDKKVGFRQEIDNTIPNNLYGDEGRIKQILTNILGNAVKFTEEGFISMKVTWKRVGDDAKITFAIADTGQGIRKDDLDKIFRRFRRIDMKKNRSIEGTGLGLSIAKELAILMDGDITVDSVYGKGSVFYFTVTQKIAEEGEYLGDREYDEWKDFSYELTHGKVSYKGASVLVVDDNQMNLRVAKGLLKNYEVDLETASSGQQCLDMTEDMRFDLILLDHMMPELNGIETLKLLRERAGFETPVIALTANAMNGVRQQYIEAGFQEYLSKPIQIKELEKIMHKYLKAFENINYTTMSEEKQKTQEPPSYTGPFLTMDVSGDATVRRMGSEEVRRNVAAASAGAVSKLEQSAADVAAAWTSFSAGLDRPQGEVSGTDPDPTDKAKEPKTYDWDTLTAFDESELQELPSEKETTKEITPVIKHELEEAAAFAGVASDPVSKPELDVKQGLEYSMGKIDFYMETLEIYLRQTASDEIMMNEYLEAEDLENYSVLIHGMKSNSRIIGAVELGDEAERLEKAGKAGDIDFVFEHYPMFRTHLQKVRGEVKAYMEANGR